MLRWALVFFIVAIIAALFGFGGVAAAATGIAKLLFFVLVLFLVALLFGLLGGRTPPTPRRYRATDARDAVAFDEHHNVRRDLAGAHVQKPACLDGESPGLRLSASSLGRLLCDSVRSETGGENPEDQHTPDKTIHGLPPEIWK